MSAEPFSLSDPPADVAAARRKAIMPAIGFVSLNSAFLSEIACRYIQQRRDTQAAQQAKQVASANRAGSQSSRILASRPTAPHPQRPLKPIPPFPVRIRLYGLSTASMLAVGFVVAPFMKDLAVEAKDKSLMPAAPSSQSDLHQEMRNQQLPVDEADLDREFISLPK